MFHIEPAVCFYDVQWNLWSLYCTTHAPHATASNYSIHRSTSVHIECLIQHGMADLWPVRTVPIGAALSVALVNQHFLLHVVPSNMSKPLNNSAKNQQFLKIVRSLSENIVGNVINYNFVTNTNNFQINCMCKKCIAKGRHTHKNMLQIKYSHSKTT